MLEKAAGPENPEDPSNISLKNEYNIHFFRNHEVSDMGSISSRKHLQKRAWYMKWKSKILKMGSIVFCVYFGRVANSINNAVFVSDQKQKHMSGGNRRSQPQRQRRAFRQKEIG